MFLINLYNYYIINADSKPLMLILYIAMYDAFGFVRLRI